MVGFGSQQDDNSVLSVGFWVAQVMQVLDMERCPGAGFLFIPEIFSI